MAQDSHFDMPHQLWELTETNVAQARGAYIQFLDAMVQTTNMWRGAMPFNAMASDMKVIHEMAILVGIQSRYAQTAQTKMQAYALLAQELGRLMAEASQIVRPKG